MAKKAKAPPAPKGREEALKAAMSGLSLMIAAAGMPGQVRLASREPQRPPTKSSGAEKKGRGR
jgi:hypothetical protein